MELSTCYSEDVSILARSPLVPWDMLEGMTVIVTGATGLIGGLVSNAILAHNGRTGGGIHLVLPVRNVQKAEELFGGCEVRIVPWDAVSGVHPDVGGCDYIVHCASNTDSRLMIERPVDTMLTIVEGTRAMLELARLEGARMCLVSSMEVYGGGANGFLDETRGGELDAMNVRSSYPQAKQLAETMCASYAKQYRVEACVARLAQSFGPGIADTDRRVFAEFARSCLNGNDIHLHTDGSKSNMYVYTADAVTALLLLVARGVSGEAYNVANEETFCSIREMAELVADKFGKNTKIQYTIDHNLSKRYAVSGRLWLDTSKLRALGWKPTRDLLEMYGRMMMDWD